MTARSAAAHLTDILDAIGNIRAAMHDVSWNRADLKPNADQTQAILPQRILKSFVLIVASPHVLIRPEVIQSAGTDV
ncbi:MAG TPA: hypothetical protein VHX61_10610 [Rhizomicrobium sp.]|jgi:hypothetical protein|nr:hypothetical protein [Rhizomicrobium sp.]